MLERIDERLTVAEAAEACGVAPITIRRALAAGRLPGAEKEVPGRRTSPWRIPIEDLRRAGWDPPAAPSFGEGHAQGEAESLQALTVVAWRSAQLLESLDTRVARIEAALLDGPATVGNDNAASDGGRCSNGW